MCETKKTKTGKLYGVGIGPGDPELLTVKAARLLREADRIALPETDKGGRLAWEIAAEYAEGKPLLPIKTPMVRDRAVVEAGYQTAAQEIGRFLAQGETVALLTLGDPTIYSTCVYICREVQALGYETELVPGVPSFCAAAARLGHSLCERSEPLVILPASHRAEEQKRPNKVYMKAGKDILALQNQLRESGELERASYVANCGLPGERLLEHFADLKEPEGYFSLVLVKGE